jgi:SH3 domain-containing YSC84-like protein 1
MKKLISGLIVVLTLAVAVFAEDEREEDRVKDAGVVIKEILNIPDDIPQDLLDKAECVIVLPSVKKGAFGIGGSYGRGVMICRSGEHYKGPWGAPAMYALEGVSIGFQLGGQATDFRPASDESQRRRIAALQQSESWAPMPPPRPAPKAARWRALPTS